METDRRIDVSGKPRQFLLCFQSVRAAVGEVKNLKNNLEGFSGRNGKPRNLDWNESKNPAFYRS
jgi:hypothetical protein